MKEEEKETVGATEHPLVFFITRKSVIGLIDISGSLLGDKQPNLAESTANNSFSGKQEVLYSGGGKNPYYGVEVVSEEKPRENRTKMREAELLRNGIEWYRESIHGPRN